LTGSRDYVKQRVSGGDGPPPEDPMRCVVYCRVSSDRQREAHTIASQRDLLLAYAGATGWNVVAVEEDDGVSGEIEPWARPGMARALDLVRKRAVDVLLVIDIDRISRDSNNIAFGIVRRDLREHGVRLATPRGMLDLDSPEQRLQQDILAALASFERHKILERTIRGRRNAVLRGERPLAKPPIGYRCNEETRSVEICEEEAPVVREVFRLVAAGRCAQAVERELKARGLKSGRVDGGRETFLIRRTITRMVRRDDYWTGHWRAQEKWDPKFVIDVPALVDRDSWLAANAVLDGRKQSPRRLVAEEYLLRGFARCAHCGRKMRAQTAGRGGRYYRCEHAARPPANGERCPSRKGIRAPDVDRLVWDYVARVVREPGALRAEVERALAAEAGATEAPSHVRGRIEAELASLAEERSRVLRLARKGTITDDELEAELADIDRQRAPLLNRLELVRVRESGHQEQRAALAAVEELLAGIRDVVDDLTFDERQAVVRDLLDDVFIDADGKQVEIRALVLGKDPNRVLPGSGASTLAPSPSPAISGSGHSPC
jgi:site-specific DNA recombinase